MGGGRLAGGTVAMRSWVNVTNPGGVAINPLYDYTGSSALETVAPAFATVVLGSGGLVEGAVAGRVTTTNSPNVTTTVGNGTAVEAGTLSIVSTVYQKAQSDGLSVGVGGLAGVGIIRPAATSAGSTTTGFAGTLTGATTVTIRSKVDASSESDAAAAAVGARGRRLQRDVHGHDVAHGDDLGGRQHQRLGRHRRRVGRHHRRRRLRLGHLGRRWSASAASR